MFKLVLEQGGGPCARRSLRAIAKPMENGFQNRKETVVELLRNYGEALKSVRSESVTVHTDVYEVFESVTTARGVNISASELIAAITVLESLLDFSEEASVEGTQAAIMAYTLGLVNELEKRLKNKDKKFFTDD